LPIDYQEIGACLDEIDRELFRVADHKDCQRFHAQSQLTAVILLLMRSSSLLRSLLVLHRAVETDGFQVVLRAFEEAWRLALDFRLAAHHARISDWFAETKSSWSALMLDLMQFAKSRGLPSPMIEGDIRSLSEVAHPMKSAAENSVVLCGRRLGIVQAAAELVEERQNEEQRILAALDRVLWLMLYNDTDLIPLHVKRENLPLSWQYLQDH